MAIQHGCVAALIAVLIPVFAAADAPTLRVELTKPDGSPANSVRVKLLGLPRENIDSFHAGFTDLEGKLNIAFEADRHDRRGERPGYGAWRVAAQAEGYAPVISRILVWYEDEEIPSFIQRRADEATEAWDSGESYSNWAHADPKLLRAGETHELPLRFEEGETVTLQVKDSLDRPIANHGIGVEICLEGQARIQCAPVLAIDGTSTGEDGFLTLHHVGDYVYGFAVGGEDAQKFTAPGTSVRTGAQRFHPLRQGDLIRFDVDTGRRVRFEVVDAETGDPLPRTGVTSVFRFPGATQGGSALWTDARGRIVINNHPTIAVSGNAFLRKGYETKFIRSEDIPDDEWVTVELEPADDPEGTGPISVPDDFDEARARALESWSRYVEGEVTIGTE